jgi:hypothetical protein
MTTCCARPQPEDERALRPFAPAAVFQEAPQVALRFVPNSPEDPTQLREGGAELAVGIYGDLPRS